MEERHFRPRDQQALAPRLACVWCGFETSQEARVPEADSAQSKGLPLEAVRFYLRWL